VTTEREVERVGERSTFLCLREAEFSIAQYEFSPVCGMQEENMHFINLFDFQLLSFHPPVTHSPTVRLCIASGRYVLLYRCYAHYSSSSSSSFNSRSLGWHFAFNASACALNRSSRTMPSSYCP
jgi:hypothetical protein